MKNNVRILSLLLALILSLSVLPSVALADDYTGWKQGSDGTWYYLRNGDYAAGWVQYNGYWYYLNPEMYADGLFKIGNSRYCFEKNGRMTTGWKSFTETYTDDDGTEREQTLWRYFGTNGRMVTGWQKIKDYWYRFDSDGFMLTGWYNSDPKFLVDGSSSGNWFYLTPGSGRMVTGWKYFTETMQAEDGSSNSFSYWSYFDENGIMATGWKLIKNYWYRFDNDGVMLTGWYNSDPNFLVDGSSNGKWFYLDLDSGRMAVGWKYIEETYTDDDGETKTDKYWAYFDENGYQITGSWKQIKDSWYYFDDYGRMLCDGLYKFGDYKYYYFLPNGRMATGWQKIPMPQDDGSVVQTWYYFQENGLMKTGGWQQDGENWYFFDDCQYYRGGLYLINDNYYYFQDNGIMLTGWKKIDGKWRYFAASGKMVKEGSITDGGKRYYIHDYVMLTNRWVYNNYYGSNGAMLVNTTQKINGTTYTFDSHGSSTPSHFEILTY